MLDSGSTLKLLLYCSFLLRRHSFGLIRIRISDPRSVWIMLHQRKLRVNPLTRADSPVPLMHHDPDICWITDPDPDHPKGTRPKLTGAFETGRAAWKVLCSSLGENCLKSTQASISVGFIFLSVCLVFNSVRLNIFQCFSHTTEDA